jgi:acylphosphatase
MTVSKKLYIKGRVQGVWYRASTRNKAEELELCGFVRNQLDGSVYAEVEGEPDAVHEFIEWCWRGPQLARVRDVAEEEQEVQGFTCFEVRG